MTRRNTWNSHHIVEKNFSDITFKWFDESEVSSVELSEGSGIKQSAKYVSWTNDIAEINKKRKLSSESNSLTIEKSSSAYYSWMQMNKKSCEENKLSVLSSNILSETTSSVIASNKRPIVRSEIKRMLKMLAEERKIQSVQISADVLDLVSMKDIISASSSINF
jgi:hypothetical protein